jgi:hypothetical protein
MAGLLKNDPQLTGITYWAVGSGDESWDAARPSVDPRATRLAAEFDRQAIAPAQTTYLHGDGRRTAAPCACIEVSAAYTWPQDRTLREFGLYGGDAGETADSGYLINYVIHPRIDLKAGAALTRRMRFSLRPDIGPYWLTLPEHWMGAAPVDRIDGIGKAYAKLLDAAGVGTIGALAAVEPAVLAETMPLMKLVELRAKARIVLRTVAEIEPVAGITARSAWDVLVTPVDTLAADAGLAPEPIIRLREQIGTLQLGLDNRYLHEVTIGHLALPA